MPTETIATTRDLREHLSEHLRHVNSGGSVVVTSRGQPVARLVPIAPASDAPRPFGFMKGQIKIAPNFDETPADVLAAMDATLFPMRRAARR
jgi:prevent-host-death family protein